jgi:hypothetical protein
LADVSNPRSGENAGSPPRAPLVRFAVDAESLEHNGALLKRFGFDLAELLDHFSDTMLGYGSEFRPTEQLEKIFDGHPNFPFFKTVLHGGMEYCFNSRISEDQRKEELAAILERGNHKSAAAEPVITDKSLHKDIHHGFAPPFPSKLVH